jgi:hypothetical protein
MFILMVKLINGITDISVWIEVGFVNVLMVLFILLFKESRLRNMCFPAWYGVCGSRASPKRLIIFLL